MSNLGGTPKTLREAVYNAIAIGPLCNVVDKAPHVIKDFLAQKFATAYMLSKSEEETERLQNLWQQIVKGL